MDYIFLKCHVSVGFASGAVDLIGNVMEQFTESSLHLKKKCSFAEPMTFAWKTPHGKSVNKWRRLTNISNIHECIRVFKNTQMCKPWCIKLQNSS